MSRAYGDKKEDFNDVGKLVDMGERIKLAAGPVSLRSMPR
jgi:hypothetical protein